MLAVFCVGADGCASPLAATQSHERVSGQVVQQRDAVGTGEVLVLCEARAWLAEAT